ncbi:MAG TPA: sigma-70 family RNA polymerase sigma factor [Candidatus Dormibacteraeota bacterium]|nr:sigma-70 family RNA polymerase sigma factor [Candidatus Dormibacteraeota bacterium]
MTQIALLDSECEPPGAQPAFDAIYVAHADAVFRFCVSQIGEAEAAADVTHDVFIRAFTAYDRVSPQVDTIRTWLFTIARNCSIDHHRRRSRWRRMFTSLQASVLSPLSIEMVADRRNELRRANAAIGLLRPRDRELIGLRIAAELSYRQIGSVLGISEQAAKIATRRALRKLRSKLEDESHD